MYEDPILPKQRKSDMMKMDSLHYLADQQGMAVMSFIKVVGGWVVNYFKPNRANEPKLEYCRDKIDYDLKMDAWIRACTIQSKQYPMFQDMIMGEIRRLKAMDIP